MAQEGAAAEPPGTATAETQYAAEPRLEEESLGADARYEEDEGLTEEHEFEQPAAAHGVVTPPEPPPVSSEPGEPEVVPSGYEEPITEGHEYEDGPETAEYDVE